MPCEGCGLLMRHSASRECIACLCNVDKIMKDNTEEIESMLYGPAKKRKYSCFDLGASVLYYNSFRDATAQCSPSTH